MAVGAATGNVHASALLEEQISSVLARSAASMRFMVPLLAEIQGGLNRLAARSFERAQRIPLKASTIKRKAYARKSRSSRAQDLAEIRAFAREKRAEGHNTRVLDRQWRKGRSQTKRPLPNARVLERVGGFIESLTEDGAPFAVRKNEGTDTLRFGTRLGGLWAIFGGNGRLDFLVTDTSIGEALETIRDAQRKHVAAALERSGADPAWVREVET